MEICSVPRRWEGSRNSARLKRWVRVVSTLSNYLPTPLRNLRLGCLHHIVWLLPAARSRPEDSSGRASSPVSASGNELSPLHEYDTIRKGCQLTHHVSLGLIDDRIWSASLECGSHRVKNELLSFNLHPKNCVPKPTAKYLLYDCLPNVEVPAILWSK